MTHLIRAIVGVVLFALMAAPTASAGDPGAKPQVNRDIGRMGMEKGLTRAKVDYNLKLGPIAVKPVDAKGIKANSNVWLSIPVMNTGTQTSPATGQTLVVQCTVVNGENPCPVPESTQPLPAIESSSTKNVTLVAAEGAQPGDYKISFVLKDKKGRPPSVNIHVYAP